LFLLKKIVDPPRWKGWDFKSNFTYEDR